MRAGGKNLLEIQKEVRVLENKAQELTEALSSISNDIDEARNEGNIDTIDYEKIRLMSTHYLFGKHPLDELEDAYACQLYLETLLSVVRINHESASTVNRLIFIQWILTQSHLDLSLEDLYKETLQISASVYGELLGTLPKQYRIQLIVDLLVVANQCGQADTETISYIVSICNVLGVAKEELRILSLISNIILKQKMDRMKKADVEAVLSKAKAYKHYTSADIIRTGLLTQRTIVVSLSDSDCNSFKWKVKSLDKVEKGTVVATYREKASAYYSKPQMEIKAPCAGTIFVFRDNCTNYGVIAHETDNKDSLKAWVRKQR